MPRNTSYSYSLIRIARRSTIPIRDQIVTQVQRCIRDETLQAGDQLPSIRALAKKLSVAPNTVAAAYALLCAEGSIKSVQNVGFLVEKPLKKTNENIKSVDDVPSATLPSVSVRSEIAQIAAQQVSHQVNTPRAFKINVPLFSSATEKTWSRFAQKVGQFPERHAFYTSPQGYLPLRRLIAQRLRLERGILADPDNIIITSGSTQNLALASAVLFNPSDGVGIPAPTFQLDTATMRFHGVTPIALTTDQDGVVIEKIPFNRLKGIHVSPATQFPMSVTLSEPRRQALLDAAQTHQLWILEEDTHHLTWYEGHPLKPLRSYSRAANHVIYMESFSLILFPGVQTGYLLVPTPLRERFMGAKLLFDRYKSESNQALIAHYMMSAEYHQHIRRLKAKYQKAHHYFLKHSQAQLGDYGEFMPTRCGPHLTFILRPGFDDRVIAQKMNDAGYTLKALSDFDYPNGQHGLVFGFAGFSNDVIRLGLQTLAEIIKHSLKITN